jgi:PadR family transcriptional regulator PadR
MEETRSGPNPGHHERSERPGPPDRPSGGDDWLAPAEEATWPCAPDVLPDIRCRFPLAPPRRFLYPALLLLIAEEARHGYGLAESLGALGIVRIDRPSVYRALADLERDGLVRSFSAPPKAGATRRMYQITADGELVLEAWMSVVAQERAALDKVLQRYWYCNAERLALKGRPASSAVADPRREGPGERGPGERGPGQPAARVRFEIAPDRSDVVVEARSNIGPIAFRTSGIDGFVEADVRDGLVDASTEPTGELRVRVIDLTSGNAFYDAELLRRVDARRFPTALVVLRSARRVGGGNRYELSGEATIHGVTRELVGAVTATVVERDRHGKGGLGIDRRITVVGEHVLDIRQFAMDVPTMPLFKIYPDVRLHLHVEGDAVETAAGPSAPDRHHRAAS